MPIDLILYAVVALGLILWLRSVLGTRSGDEPSRPNPFLGQPLDATLKPAPAAIGLAAPAAAARGLPNTATVTAPAQEGLAAIAKADNSFDIARFVHGAQEAFVMIVEAFAAADRATLRDLLADSVYQAFASVIDRREQAGEKASVEIHAVRRLEIVSAALVDRTATITMRFVADETVAVRDKDGKVIEGNPDRVSETIDIWSFARDIAAKTQPWRVTATREEENAAAAPDATPPTAG